MNKGWSVADVHEVPPCKPDWPQTWKSIRHHFGITAFGINAVSKGEGNTLIPEHDERASGQQEVFFVHEGEVRAVLDGEETRAGAGAVFAVEPGVRRSFEALASPTTLLAIGATPGAAYEIGAWER